MLLLLLHVVKDMAALHKHFRLHNSQTSTDISIRPPPLPPPSGNQRLA